MMHDRCVAVFFSLMFVCRPSLLSQDSVKSRLSLDRLYSSREFRGQSFGPARWMKDGSSYTTLENSEKVKDGQDIVLYSAASGNRKILVASSKLIPAGDSLPVQIEDYHWSADGNMLLIFTNTRRVWRQNTVGDYWVLNMEDGHLSQVGKQFDPSSLMFAKFSPDGNRLGYVCRNNVFVERLKDHAITQLTTDGNEEIVNGTTDWVYEEEFGLQDAFRWSPDSKSIAFWQFDTRGVKEFTLINYTDSLYPQLKRYKYPKVGETNSAYRIGVVSAESGPIVWMKIPGDPRNSYVPRMEWAANSNEIILQHLNRLQNRNDVMLGNAATGETKTIFTDDDSAWVEVMDDLRWIDSGTSFTWLSERDGWNHFYIVPHSGGEPKLVTKGAYDVVSIAAIDEDEGWLYFIASPDNPTERLLYRTRLDGSGKRERISPSNQAGSHSYQMSPKAKWAIHSFSTLDNPPTTDLVQLPSHRTARVLASNDSLRAKIRALQRTPVQYFKVDIGDGVLVDGWCIKPPDFDSTKVFPLFIHVYGEPAGQTAQNRWGGSTYLWHLMLAQHGYIVVSFDNHGTPAPRGRAWRKSIYRQIGILASADQAAATQALIKQWRYVDTSRIGIWGWSGGGSMTLNALFRYPDLYKTGISVAPVGNQRYYDDVYQERYMGLPDDNAAGYREGSPVTYAKNLKGNLLLIHGTGDDNVHFQNSEAIVNELVANNKLFTMMAYPNRSHGIFEGKGTTRHVYETITAYLYRTMPGGGRVAGASVRGDGK